MVGDGCHRGLTLNAARQLEIRMFASGIANCRDLMNVSVQFPDRHDLEVNPENPDSRQGSTNSFNSYHRNTRSNRSDRKLPAGSRSPPNPGSISWPSDTIDPNSRSASLGATAASDLPAAGTTADCNSARCSLVERPSVLPRDTSSRKVPVSWACRVNPDRLAVPADIRAASAGSSSGPADRMGLVASFPVASPQVASPQVASYQVAWAFRPAVSVANSPHSGCFVPSRETGWGSRWADSPAGSVRTEALPEKDYIH